MPFIGCSLPSGERITIQICPPGRTSIWHSGLVKPCGPHQAAMCSGSVHMRNTSSRGASSSRVSDTSPRKCGIVGLPPRAPGRQMLGQSLKRLPAPFDRLGILWRPVIAVLGRGKEHPQA